MNRDLVYLSQALELAKIRRGFCAPNPSVGAVIVRDNQVLATGYHFAAGHPHAEVDALKKINNEAEGATIYVTLEPCCHVGKTPPCTDALIKAGIKRVIYGYRDPNPIVAGKGEAKLLAAGIECQSIQLPEIDTFYQSYRHWLQTHKPFVTAKIAMTLDGKIADINGQPIQITGALLGQLTHQSRKESDAILTTVKTIIYDNPQLNVRQQNEVISKPLYLLDSQLNLPLKARIFNTTQSITVFHSETASIERKKALTSLNVRCIAVNEDALISAAAEHNPNQGRNEPKSTLLNLNQVIEFIGKDGIHNLWVEAGGHCFRSFFQQSLLQKALIYISPWAMGAGLSAFSGQTLDFRKGKINWQPYGQDILCEIHW